jgi:hypothetical protein
MLTTVWRKYMIAIIYKVRLQINHSACGLNPKRLHIFLNCNNENGMCLHMFEYVQSYLDYSNSLNRGILATLWQVVVEKRMRGIEKLSTWTFCISCFPHLLTTSPVWPNCLLSLNNRGSTVFNYVVHLFIHLAMI